ncbi:serine/arginine-rich splicing factor 11-like isoform X3 [Cyprinodon tularosa]|uniref:serine/arginine-rich splicing factor 11-like isoform X3 n=1 Tax=Cyprinodon variegatus TaxID=28743 RepID=UPI000742C874|nr:PREDICTED: serine/arginine-rich splicing factor 11-like isoform X3 [Cyprinodon variegatus]XP_038159699.1 serine/arginine-rich splicing factor 11-like isoform X3 [Cyprinodon tularosa]
MSYTTRVVQVTNVSPSTTSEQMRTLFGFLGTIEELKLFPPDDSPMPVTSRVCFVKFQEPESVGVSQHLTNTVFVDRALIVVPFAEGSIPDEAKALSLLAPANAVAGILPGGGLLPTPNPIPNAALGANPFGAPTIDPMAAFGFAGPNMNPQAADQLLKMMTDPKLNPLAAGLNLSASLKADASNKEIEEAMKRVREAQSLISAAIEPGHKESKKKHSRSRSRSRRRRSRSRSRHSRRRTRSRSRRRSSSRSRRRSKSPRRRHTHSRDRGRRTRSRSRRHRRSRSASRSPKKSPKRRVSPSPSPRRHKKEKKRDKDRERERRSDKERVREERERSTSKKKKSKDKERERERKSDVDKGDIKITRDYDEEEQGYDSEKERKDSDDSAMSPQSVEGNGSARLMKQAKVNGADDHHEEDMDVSD